MADDGGEHRTPHQLGGQYEDAGKPAGGWMNSKAHRENILRKGITEFGFSLVGAPGKPMYAVQTFAGPGFGGGMAGTLSKKVSEKEAVAKALELLNAERKKAGSRRSRKAPRGPRRCAPWCRRARWTASACRRPAR